MNTRHTFNIGRHENGKLFIRGEGLIEGNEMALALQQRLYKQTKERCAHIPDGLVFYGHIDSSVPEHTVYRVTNSRWGEEEELEAKESRELCVKMGYRYNSVREVN